MFFMADPRHLAIASKLVKEIALKLGNAIAMPVLGFTPNNASPDLPGILRSTTASSGESARASSMALV